MRPVNRGDAPRVYAKYQDAIGDLEDRLGTYCSYCERRLPTSLAVEHVTPKSRDRSLETEWTNFLLGCTNCNSVKGATETNSDDFLWPDRDNTLRVFRYGEGGFVEIQPELAPDVAAKAIALCELVGLDRHRLAPADKRPAPRDKRWKDREQVWRTATLQKQRLRQFPAGVQPTVRQFILEAAEGYGFFSVWMNVFDDDPEVRKGLVARFRGTAVECFDGNGNPVFRPGGRI